MSYWQEICKTDMVPKQGARSVSTGDKNIAIFRTFDNDFFAIENNCPHKGGPLAEGIVHGHYVQCPLHNLIFDLKSGKAEWPDKECLKHYPTKIIDNMVYVNLSLENAYAN